MGLPGSASMPLAAPLILALAAIALPAHAGPTLETTESSAIGAQATFNNSWAQTFEAKGSMTIDSAGGGVLRPFQQVTGPSDEQLSISPTSISPALLPNSGLAELVATVANLSSTGGDLQAAASIDSGELLGGSNNPNNIVFNTSNVNGLPALEITPGTLPNSVIGASIIGTNIGASTLQVTGSLTSTVINTLTAF